MFQLVMHEIRVIHNYGRPESYRFHRGGCDTIEICKDCGEEQRTLHLSKGEGPNLSDLAKHGERYQHKQMQSALRDLAKQCNEAVKVLEEYKNSIIAGTKYSNIHDLAETMDQRYIGQISAVEVPFGVLDLWVNTSSKKPQRKVLLGCKQGLVCNRCDTVMYSLNDLTIDHIVPRSRGGESVLKNLQLLCRECNHLKGDNEPSDKDISPFAYDGVPCVHNMTCGDIDNLRPLHKKQRHTTSLHPVGSAGER